MVMDMTLARRRALSIPEDFSRADNALHNSDLRLLSPRITLAY